ncbi:MAG: Calx-beta domain-containing protein [Isosphaeraceae bacterium]
MASYPFRQPERVFYNPYNPAEIWVTSFGGGVMVGTTSTTPQPGAFGLGSATYSVNENAGTVTVTVNRTGGTSGAVSVHYATSNGTATAGSDYTAVSGDLTWADGDSAPKSFTIPILDDTVTEPNETVNITLSSPAGGATLGSPATSVLTIVDNDPPPAPAGTLQFSASTASVNESAGTVVLTVTRLNGSGGAVSVQFATANGTAVAPGDFAATAGTLSWAAGETGSKTITVPIVNDTLVEGNETFTVALSSPAGGATLGTPASVVVTIVDDDVAPPPPPPPPTGGKPYAVGTDAGMPATVTMYNADGTVRFKATPFGTTFTNGLRVAVGDVTGDGVPDVVVSNNGGGVVKTVVRVLDGKTGALLPSVISAGTYYYGTASLSVGDVTGDGVADIAVGTDDGGPRARVYRGGDFLLLSNFLAGPSANAWGRTEVALADMNGDKLADLAVSTSYSTGIRVGGFNGKTLRPGVTPGAVFTAYTQTGKGFEGAPYLAAGDVNGDGFADLVFGSGAWSTTRVLVISGKALVQTGKRETLVDFAPAGTAYTFGVRVALRDLDGSGRPALIIGAGTGKGSRVTIFSNKSLVPGAVPPVASTFEAYPGFSGGIFVG